MLIGNNNSINLKLVEEISTVSPMIFVDYKDLVSDPESISAKSPHIALVNLMDLGNVETELLAILKTNFSDLKIVAIHSFQSEHLIAKTLDKGYDSYISIFDVSEQMFPILDELRIN